MHSEKEILMVSTIAGASAPASAACVPHLQRFFVLSSLQSGESAMCKSYISARNAVCLCLKMGYLNCNGLLFSFVP